MSTFNDQRVHKRRVLRGPAELTLTDAAPVKVQLSSISEGGVMVVTEVNLRAPLAGNLRFNDPSKGRTGAPVVVQVRVVHSVYSSAEGGFKVGLQFAQLPPGLQQNIAHFVNGLG